MAIAKMKLVNIVGRLRDFDDVVRKCCINGDFHAEMSSLALEAYDEFVPVDEPNPYTSAMQSAVDIAVHSNIPLSYSDFGKLKMSFEELAKYVEKAQQELAVLNGRVSEITQKSARLEQVLTSLSHLKNFGIDLDELFGCKFIIFKFGRLPKDSYSKISSDEAYDNRLFFPLEEDELFYWGFYVTNKEGEAEAEEFFTSLYFEQINIVEEAHGTPAQANEHIEAELKNLGEQLKTANAGVEKYWAENRDTFLRVYSELRYLHDSFDIRKYAAKCDDNFYIFGWVPENDVETFEKRFEKIPYVDCIIEETEEAGNITPPTNLINNGATKPFENFVEMYGLPSYNEIDPTPLMAITYSIIFGIMFGDLGQGFIILLIAIFMKAKKMFLGDILIRCSIFSMIFGTLFNSFFGYENILPIPTVLPVHRDEYTTTILIVSIAGGVIMLLVCMIINLINGIRQHRVDKLFLSQNGLAGIIFYVALLVGGVLMMVFSKNIFSPLFVIFLIIVPLLIIGFQEPLTHLIQKRKDWMPEKKGEFFVQTFFELFEVLLSYITNTISFVRVGAFILSHAGMMTAVFALSSLAGKGYPVVFVIGNVFVIAMEGLVVGIQGIRLQFYEMFSRFYQGEGKAYEPYVIKYNG